jgi:hypothetical protein
VVAGGLCATTAEVVAGGLCATSAEVVAGGAVLIGEASEAGAVTATGGETESMKARPDKPSAELEPWVDAEWLSPVETATVRPDPPRDRSSGASKRARHEPRGSSSRTAGRGRVLSEGLGAWGRRVALEVSSPCSCIKGGQAAAEPGSSATVPPTGAGSPPTLGGGRAGEQTHERGCRGDLSPRPDGRRGWRRRWWPP